MTALFQTIEVGTFFSMIFARHRLRPAICFAKEVHAGEREGYQMFTIGSLFVKRTKKAKSSPTG